MSTSDEAAQHDQMSILDVFCSPEGETYRLYVRPGPVPRHLARSLDEHGEAYPVALDFDDLEHHMQRHSQSYTKVPSSAGGVQLVARGEAATDLAVWLSTAISSGIRGRPSHQ